MKKISNEMLAILIEGLTEYKQKGVIDPWVLDDGTLVEPFDVLLELQELRKETNIFADDTDIRQCQECKRNLPNNLINAMIVGDETVIDICAICARKIRNKAMLPQYKNKMFTGELAQKFYDKTVEYYKKTNQITKGR